MNNVFKQVFTVVMCIALVLSSAFTCAKADNLPTLEVISLPDKVAYEKTECDDTGEPFDLTIEGLKIKVKDGLGEHEFAFNNDSYIGAIEKISDESYIFVSPDSNNWSGPNRKMMIMLLSSDDFSTCDIYDIATFDITVAQEYEYSMNITKTPSEITYDSDADLFNVFGFEALVSVKDLADDSKSFNETVKSDDTEYFGDLEVSDGSRISFSIDNLIYDEENEVTVVWINDGSTLALDSFKCIVKEYNDNQEAKNSLSILSEPEKTIYKQYSEEDGFKDSLTGQFVYKIKTDGLELSLKSGDKEIKWTAPENSYEGLYKLEDGTGILISTNQTNEWDGIGNYYVNVSWLADGENAESDTLAKVEFPISIVAESITIKNLPNKTSYKISEGVFDSEKGFNVYNLDLNGLSIAIDDLINEVYDWTYNADIDNPYALKDNYYIDIVSGNSRDDGWKVGENEVTVWLCYDDGTTSRMVNSDTFNITIVNDVQNPDDDSTDESALLIKKEAAIKSIKEFLDITKYDEDGRVEIEKIIKEATEQIKTASSEEEINIIVDATKIKLSEVKMPTIDEDDNVGETNQPEFTGDNQTFDKNNPSDSVFKSSSDISKFKHLEVDGKVVDASNYVVKAGSTIVTLNKEYIDTLSIGKHTVSIVSEDGIASGTFEIVGDIVEDNSTEDDKNNDGTNNDKEDNSANDNKPNKEESEQNSEDDIKTSDSFSNELMLTLMLISAFSAIMIKRKHNK